MIMGTSIRHGKKLEKTRISSKESIGLCESNSYKPWFDEECLKLVVRRKQAELQWLQEPSIVNEGNLRNVRRDASRRFRNKKREYLKGKITDIEIKSKNKNIRDLFKGITEFKKGYQPKTILVKYERGDLLADPQEILTRWKNYFCQLLNVQGQGLLGRPKFTLQSDLYQSLVPLSFRSL
jgi:hypothetical protein